MKAFLYSILLAFSGVVLAQTPATDAQALSSSLDYFKSLQQNAEVKNVPSSLFMISKCNFTAASTAVWA